MRENQARWWLAAGLCAASWWGDGGAVRAQPVAPPPPSQPATQAERAPWSDPPQDSPEELLRPSPGRVPVRIESTGEALEVGLAGGGGSGLRGRPSDRASSRGERRVLLCRTPCTLYARPGTLAIHTTADGVVSRLTSIEVPEGEGIRVRLWATSSLAHTASLTMAVAGLSVGLLGPFLALRLAPSSDDQEPWLVAAGVMAASGLAVGALGLIWLRNIPLGVQQRGALGASSRTPTLSLGAAPAQGGAWLLGALRF